MSTFALVFAALLSTNAVGAAGTTNKAAKAVTSARITSDCTYYDRKEGLAVFKGHVHVDDAEYQLHADRAYVFMNVASNTLSRIAATGGVAMTNASRRAYGTKVTYHRDDGLVVLHGEPGKPATVVDETEQGARTAKGSRIRFWINREQVEVLEADFSVPRPEGGKAALALPGTGSKK